MPSAQVVFPLALAILGYAQLKTLWIVDNIRSVNYFIQILQIVLITFTVSSIFNNATDYTVN